VNDTGLTPRKDRLRKALEAMKRGAGLFIRPKDWSRDMAKDWSDGTLPFREAGTGGIRQWLEVSDDELIALPPPFGSGRNAGDTILGAIHPDCLRPQGALEYILFLARRSSQEALARGGLDLPARADAFDAACPDERLRGFYAQIKERLEVAQALHTGAVPFGSTFMRDEVFPQVVLYLQGEMEFDEMFDGIKRLARRFERRVARLTAQATSREGALG
jgi:hypothetical protein